MRWPWACTHWASVSIRVRISASVWSNKRAAPQGLLRLLVHAP